MLNTWPEAFFYTQLVEIPVYLVALKNVPSLCLRYSGTPSTLGLAANWQTALLIAFGASAITHPFVWFVFPHLFAQAPYALYLFVAETFAVVVEAFYLRSFGVRHYFAWSLIANGLSLGFGLVFFY